MIGLTSYLTIVYKVKMESGCKINIFGLQLMVKSGLGLFLICDGITYFIYQIAVFRNTQPAADYTNSQQVVIVFGQTFKR